MGEGAIEGGAKEYKMMIKFATSLAYSQCVADSSFKLVDEKVPHVS